ncbi:MAG TPA: zf-HC2 domain-containing protein [Vicinamibacterales bacterium]|nr:zf-HC2 domain-containing protein [Vicinamibacterales bacterium]
MITADCDSIRDHLDSFVDGELRGHELRHVSDHLDACRRCSEEVDTRRTLGGLIRDSVAESYHRSIPSGLSAGVVARVRAESYFSWRSVLSRGFDDWHWLLVGGGAVSATFLSMALCSAILLFGTARPQAGSLSSLGTTLKNSSGALYAEVSRQGSDREVILVQVGDAAPSPTPLPANWGVSEEQQLVEALGQVLVRHGNLVELSSMPESERQYAKWLLERIAEARRSAPEPTLMGPLTVHRLHLVTNTDVRALY